MTVTRRLAALATLTCALILSAEACAAADPATTAMAPLPAAATVSKETKPMYDYRDQRLPNGLRVITLEDFSSPIVAVQVWYHVGSKDERPDRQGFAHMFEHMMFRGTDRLGPTDHFDYVRRTGGVTNAFTSNDVTVYHEIVPSNQLELALWLEAERMAFLKIDQASFDTERKVVEEERRMRTNGAYGTFFEKLEAEIFKVHPYRWTPIGRIPHLRAAKVEELQAFWQRYYVPNNATLVIAGAVPHDQSLALATRYFGWLAKQDAPPVISVREPPATAGREIVIAERNAPAPLVGVVFRTVPEGHDDAVPLAMLIEILGAGRSSRLHRELVAEQQLATRVTAFSETLEQDGFLCAWATLPATGGNPEPVRRIITSHFERLRCELVGDQELLKARNQALKDLVTDMLRLQSKAQLLGEAAVLKGDLGQVNRMLDQVRRVTAGDIQRVAKNYLSPNQALLFTVPQSALSSPGTKAATPAGGDEDEPAALSPPAGASALPAAATSVLRPHPPRPDSFPAKPPLAGMFKDRPKFAFSGTRLENGLKVIVVPNHTVPYVTAELNLLAGSWTESQVGAAAMAMRMLERGTTRHTDAELADELGTYAISFWGSADKDSAAAGVGCLTEHLERALGLLTEAALTPTFPPAEFEKIRRQLRTELKISSAEAGYVADRELRRALYGSHPYARTPTGEVADVEALKLENVKDWWRQFVRPDMAVLIFAGDIDEARAVELARKSFGQWRADGPAPQVTPPDPPAALATRIILVDRPGSIQSQIRVAQAGLTRRDPDYFTSLVVSGYFGGGFSSRLNETVRVKRGLTYGVGGGFDAGRFLGSFSLRTFSQSRSTAEAVAALIEEVRRLQAEPPSATELEVTKSAHLGSFARNRETPQQVAGDRWLIESQGLPANYLDLMLDGVQAATADQCSDLVRKRLDPAKLVIVVAGDASAIKADLEKLYPVTVVPADPSGK